MITTGSGTRTRNSLLLSLILHIVIVLVLGFILMEHQQEKIRESIAVDMVKAMDRTVPPVPLRRIEPQKSIPDFLRPGEQRSNTEFNPQKSMTPRVDFSKPWHSSDTKVTIPELTTDARFDSRFDAPLSAPAGIKSSIIKPGSGTGRSGTRSGTSSIGIPNGAGIFETGLYWIARNIISKNKTGREDIVFLIDASGTMGENITAVARYVSRMIDVFEESDLDYTIGVVRFNRVLKVNDIKIYEQTKSVNQIKMILKSIKCEGDENSFDAIETGLTQIKFRNLADRTFILITDEAFLKPRSGAGRPQKAIKLVNLLKEEFQEILRMCQNADVKVNVLGIDDEMHKSLAKETGGLWFQIPQQADLP